MAGYQLMRTTLCE